MQDSELRGILGRLNETSRQQLNMTLEMMCGLAAVVDAIQQTIPEFGSVFRDKYRNLRCGELMKTPSVASFEELLSQLSKPRGD
jgi:hypothetical protein